MRVFVILTGLVVWLIFSCAPKSAIQAPQSNPAPIVVTKSASGGWEEQWDGVVKEGKKEGWVVIYSTLGSDTRDFLTRAFKEKYGILLEFIAARGGETAQKLLTERRAGIYNADIWLGGVGSVITFLKPQKVFEPLEPSLILPEVRDPKMWVGGELEFVDKDRTMMAHLSYIVPPVAINTSLVKPDEIKSHRDLLQPKWKGKMVMQEPWSAGTGISWFSVVSHPTVMGLDFMRELARQEPVIISDRRLQMEWVAQGKYPVAIAPQSDTVGMFKREGAPVAQLLLTEGNYVAAGSGFIVLVSQASHPNAAKLFINWFLSKETQTLYSKSNLLPSSRLDVPTEHVDPISVRQPAIKYFNRNNEEFIAGDLERSKLAREIFGQMAR